MYSELDTGVIDRTRTVVVHLLTPLEYGKWLGSYSSAQKRESQRKDLLVIKDVVLLKAISYWDPDSVFYGIRG